LSAAAPAIPAIPAATASTTGVHLGIRVWQRSRTRENRAGKCQCGQEAGRRDHRKKKEPPFGPA
jgi:hypothetical protein